MIWAHAGTNAAPRKLVVHPNAPDPFNPTTTLAYTLDDDTDVLVTIVDVRGRVVRRLFSGPQTRGSHRLPWDGRRDDGTPLPSGVYYARVRTPAGTAAECMTLVR